ncbi:MAG: division/cell wall cluster transcriptional repressor MraZ [Clostridiales bacterium]|nr:division/cell wall cluster transcriptional repressor MraZ [Clostridiales bacterium]
MFAFTGEFHHQIDEKGRIRIPAHFKEALGSSPMIVKGTNCLYMYAKEKGQEVIKAFFLNKDSSDEAYRRTVRIIGATAIFAEEDKQGRVQLTAPLIAHAKLKKNVVSIGTFDRVEIWSEEGWADYIEGADVDFDACVSSVKNRTPGEKE